MNRRTAMMFRHDRADAMVGEEQRRGHADEAAPDNEDVNHLRLSIGEW